MKTYFKKYKWYIFGGQFFKLIEAILELMIPLIVADIIDRGLNGPTETRTSYIMSKGALMLALGVIGFLCALTCQFLAAKASEGIGREIRIDLFRKSQQMSFQQLNRYPTEALVLRMTSDVEKIQLLIAMYIRLFVRAPFLLIGAFIMCFIIHPGLSMVILGAVIFVITVSLISLKYFPAKYREIQEGQQDLSLILREHTAGIRVIRSFNRQKEESLKFSDLHHRLTQLCIRVGKRMSVMDPLVQLILNSGYLLILTFGASLVNQGILMRGSIVAYTNYLASIVAALVLVISLMNILMQGIASMKRVSEILVLPEDMAYGDSGSERVDEAEGSPALEVIHASFRYPESQADTLSQVDFHVDRKEHVGIIGGTGDGKTTLLHLLMRHYDCTEGEVRLFGQSIRSYQKEALIDIFSYAKQRGKNVGGTVRENMSWGNPDADDREMMIAVKMACAEDVLGDEGLSRGLSKEGGNLSGGQKQRLTLAKTFLKRAPVYILDDCFSALDAKTEYQVCENIRNELSDRSVIIVSQKVRSLRNCDRIYVVNQGRVEGGLSHEELYRSHAIYREICDSQSIGGEGL